MMSDKHKNIAAEILRFAGIKINCGNPWEIQDHKDDFFKRVLTQGELGFNCF